MNETELDQRLERLMAGVETHLPPVGDVRQRGERLATRRRHIRRASASVAVIVPVLLFSVFLLWPQNGDSVQVTSDGTDETMESPSTPEVDVAQLQGRTFMGDRVTEDGDVRLLAGEMPLRLSFDAEGQIKTSGGCNTTEARLDLEALAQGHLKLEPWGERFSTLAGCLTTPELMDQDTWLIDLLDSGVAWRLNGYYLVLTTEQLEIRLFDRADQWPPSRRDPADSTPQDLQYADEEQEAWYEESGLGQQLQRERETGWLPVWQLDDGRYVFVPRERAGWPPGAVTEAVDAGMHVVGYWVTPGLFVDRATFEASDFDLRSAFLTQFVHHEELLEAFDEGGEVGVVERVEGAIR
jgi:heat shock protein HslJ